MSSEGFTPAGPYVGPAIPVTLTAGVAPKSGIKAIILVCLVVLLGVNVAAILAHTSAFGTSAAAATVRNFTAQLVSMLGLTTQGAVATVQGLDAAIEGSLNAVGGAAAGIRTPVPDSSMTSSVQCRGEKGWCYVGEQDGYRSCLSVGANNYCQSGNVYPSRDLCINPSLRS
jgi:hypothetical protein